MGDRSSRKWVFFILSLCHVLSLPRLCTGRSLRAARQVGGPCILSQGLPEHSGWAAGSEATYSSAAPAGL